MSYFSKRKRNSKGSHNFFWPIFGFLIISLFLIGYYKIAKNSIWDGKSKINLAILTSNQFFLTAYNPQNQILTILKIPQDIYIKAPFSFGDYKVKAIFNLYKIGLPQKKLEKNLIIKKTLENNFFFSPEGIVEIQNGDLDDNLNRETIKKTLQKAELKLPLLLLKLNRLKTNFSLLDLIRLVFSLGKVREDKIIVNMLTNFAVFRKVKLSDGSLAKMIDEEQLEPVISDLFADEKIRDENYLISVFNASGKSGTGKKSEKIIKALGGRVMKTVTKDEVSLETVCYLKSQSVKQSVTFKKIKRIFDCREEKNKDEQREDIQLILGLNYVI